MRFKGIQIGDKHTYKDWGLYMVAPMNVESPEVKTNYIDVPGMDGVLDFSDYPTGRTNYKNRTISATLCCLRDPAEWPGLLSEIRGYCHGKKHRIISDDDRGYYWEGRMEVGAPEYKGRFFYLQISADVYPYKMEVALSWLNDWLWDDFSFLDGVIREYKDIDIAVTKEVNIVGFEKPSGLRIFYEGDEGYIVGYDGSLITLYQGMNEFPDLTISVGDNVINFQGSGTVSIDYQGGRL